MGVGDIQIPSYMVKDIVWREGGDKSSSVDGCGILERRASETERYCYWTWEDLDWWRCSGSYS